VKQGCFLVANDNRTLWSDVWLMEGFFERYYGLRKYPMLPANRALWFPNCCTIHTLGLNRPIDVIGLNEAQQIVAVRRNLQPWKLLRFTAAVSLIECESGSGLPLEYWIGKQLRFQHKDVRYATF
jgi:hypothetical protein